MATLSDQERRFLEDMARDAQAEVEMGRLAMDHADRIEVRQFGQRLVQDHTQSLEEMRALAAKKGVTLPDAVEDEHRNLMAHLKDAAGDEFDREFIIVQVREHQKDAELAAEWADKAEDADIRQFAHHTSAILREHMATAQNMKGGYQVDEF